MQTKEDYQQAIAIKKKLKESVKLDYYRLGFHIMPPTGWLNDPNGLCQFKGINHIYFQYSPFTANWGMKLWGHYTTRDWISYNECEPFLYADCEFDQDGVYSGSALVKDNEIHYFYTGNVKQLGMEYDYINNGREQNTIKIVSKDGFSYQEKICLLKNSDYPKEMSCHVRDPKIYEKNNVYYMVLGARSKSNKGCALLYRSIDLNDWTYHMSIESDDEFGYMWECPDLFDIEDKTYLICCPQGVKQDGINYANIYQFGCFEVQLDLERKTYHLSDFIELDRGFDIYAPQSFLDEKGRRILIAWMGIPDAEYDNQITVCNGWQHTLTMPRCLSIRDQQLCQSPLIEFEKLRCDEKLYDITQLYKIDVSKLCELNIVFDYCSTIEILLRSDVSLLYQNQQLTLRMSESGCGRDYRSVALASLSKLQIFIDTSSIEIFVNDGKEVFTSRYYSNIISKVELKGNYQGNAKVYQLNSFHINELDD